VKNSARKHKKELKPTKKKTVTKWLAPLLTALLVLSISGYAVINHRAPENQPSPPTPSGSETPTLPADNIQLPNPVFRSGNSIEAVLKSRTIKRNLTDQQLTLNQVSQLLWAAQGVTVDWGDRTAPSVKSVYPLTLYLITNKVDSLSPGQYQYIPGELKPAHQLKPIKLIDIKDALFQDINQSSFKDAPAIIVVTGNMGKMAEAYGGIPHDKEVYLEAGEVAQNLNLQAESLKLGLVTLSTFNELKVRELVTVPESESIIYLIPFGQVKQ